MTAFVALSSYEIHIAITIPIYESRPVVLVGKMKIFEQSLALFKPVAMSDAATLWGLTPRIFLPLRNHRNHQGANEIGKHLEAK